MSETTQSTLINTTSNATTKDNHDRKINISDIISSLCGVFVPIISVAVVIVVLKKCWRRSRCFGRLQSCFVSIEQLQFHS